MVGYPAVSVLADLVSKDLADGDLKTWAEAGARSSVYREDLAEKFKGTRELDLITLHPYFKEKYGFVPADSVPESVSWGLEMAYEDWCISQIAAKAGLDSLAQAYAAKGEYYKRYLDPETKMMRPIMSDGSFRTPFNPRYSAHMKKRLYGRKCFPVEFLCSARYGQLHCYHRWQKRTGNTSGYLVYYLFTG